MIDFDAILEDAKETIDVVLDKSVEEDADTDFEVATDVDDAALDAAIGISDTVLISDKDIEDIDAGKEPSDYDPVDVDARAAEQDKEIDTLSKDVEANALVTKDDIKDIKEGASIYDVVEKIINEDVGDIPFSLADTGANKVCEYCHANPCECGQQDQLTTSEDRDEVNTGTDDFEGTDSDDDSLYEAEDGLDDDPLTPPDPQATSDMMDAMSKNIQDAQTDHVDSNNILPPNYDDENDLNDDVDLDDSDIKDYNDNTPENHTTVNLANSNAPVNEPAGPVMPLTDVTRPGMYESEIKGESDMFDDDIEDVELESVLDEMDSTDVVDESESFEYTIANEDVEGKKLTDDQIEDLMDEMNSDELGDVEPFNDFEGSSVNTDQVSQGDFLKGMDKNVDEPELDYKMQDTLPFGDVKTKSFFDHDKDDSILSMQK